MRYSFLLLIPLFTQCNAGEKSKIQTCDYNDTKCTSVVVIKTEMLEIEDHTVFVDGLGPYCNDSLKIVQIALEYISNFKSNYSLRYITLVTDTSQIMRGETLSQNWPEINKSAIVEIMINDKREIIEYTFFGENGKICYYGPLWKPCRK